MPDGAGDYPDLRSLGVGSLRLPGVLVPEGGLPPGYPYVVLGELHQDEDESDERLPHEVRSDQELPSNADSNEGTGSLEPSHLTEQDDKAVAATTSAFVAPAGLDPVEAQGSPPPKPGYANGIGAGGMMVDSAEAIALVAAILAGPPDVPGIPDWAAVSGAAGWDDGPRSDQSAPPIMNEQTRVVEGTPASSPSEQGVEVALPNGGTVADDHSVTGHLMAPVADLTPVASAGREVGETYRDLLNDPETAASALPYLAASMLINVGRGGRFDYQRRGNHVTGFVQLPQYRDVSNFNVGLFCQQAGLSLDETLTAAGRFAQVLSRNAKPDRPYQLDPRTAEFINVGYDAGRSRLFDVPPKNK